MSNQEQQNNENVPVAKTTEELTQDVSNLVEELKQERIKKQEALDAAAALMKEEKKDTDKTDPAELVRIELERRDREQEVQAKQDAEIEFRNSISEFNPSNDPGDIKFNMFKKELSKFNLDGLKTKEEVKQRLTEVYEFANRGTKKPEVSNLNKFVSTPSSGGSQSGIELSTLTKNEETLIQSKGWSKEKYLKIKSNHPNLINGLLNR